MIRTVMNKTWFIDLEWVPDVETGSGEYRADQSVPEAAGVLNVMLRECAWRLEDRTSNG